MAKDNKSSVEETLSTDNSTHFIGVHAGLMYTAIDNLLDLKISNNEQMNNNEVIMQNADKDAISITNDTEHNNNDIHSENYKRHYFSNNTDHSQCCEPKTLNNIILNVFNIIPEISPIDNSIYSKDQHKNKETEILDLDNLKSIDKLEDTSTHQANMNDIEDIIDFVEDYNNQNNKHECIKKETENPTGIEELYEIEGKFKCNKSPYVDYTDDVISVISVSDEDEKCELNDFFIDSKETNDKYDSVTYNKIEINIDLNEIQTRAEKYENSEETSKDSNKGFPYPIDENSCCSYNSSDFEFITEDEAYTQSKYDSLNNINPDGTFKTITITQDSGFDDTNITPRDSSRPNYSSRFGNDANSYDEYNFSIKNVAHRQYRQNHVMPEGDGYLNLFQGHFSPNTPYMFENKSTMPLFMQYEGIGFDMRLARYNIEDECKLN
ncbi:unnamed protein product [Diatraea saccharalis]|uniref:Uncharacterized protein n=1 Tax=Diatraea saccharalis TaxID=40085 RepID=A0A9N9WGV0_9NEOP|nr:unnamed protein product [Diatraea saccharalis]